MMLILSLGIVAVVSAGPSASKDVASQGYKDQYCTDPRTMRKHAAYTEWADAYSCSRHRCQPGGRNLAIYTVGCKRVEAPESAIECEEVVEDTNMQFPFCCTRLRCLVVVRGEVWTRVLGQPWEVLPAAPWSHMYKMKKPPPSDTTFTPKTNEVGPVYELSEPESNGESDGKHDKVPRSGRKQGSTDTPGADCNEVLPRSAPLPAPAPDIVHQRQSTSRCHKRRSGKLSHQQKHNTTKIALSTNNDKELNGKSSNDIIRHKRGRKSAEASHYLERDDEHHDTDAQDIDEILIATEKAPEGSDEKFGMGSIFSPKEKPSPKHPNAWADIPQGQWNEHEASDLEPRGTVRKPMAMELRYTQEPKTQTEFQSIDLEKEKTKDDITEPKPILPNKNLQALVDAIGTRMKDIESVVQRMSEKVRENKNPPEISSEKRIAAELDYGGKRHKGEIKEVKPKYNHERDHASTDEERFKPRYGVRSREGPKYMHSMTENPAEPPRLDEANYFSDPSNAVRRAIEPKEPAPSHATYMAPVENYRKSPTHVTMLGDSVEDVDKKKKKHSHKKKKSKTHTHKKHHNTEKRKRFNKLTSVEIDKNGVSLEDSSAVVSR